MMSRAFLKKCSPASGVAQRAQYDYAPDASEVHTHSPEMLLVHFFANSVVMFVQETPTSAVAHDAQHLAAVLRSARAVQTTERLVVAN